MEASKKWQAEFRRLEEVNKQDREYILQNNIQPLATS